MNKKTLLSFAVLAVILSLIFTVYLFLTETRKQQLPVYGKIKPFELINAQGDRFDLTQLWDKVWVADFFFTTCSDICPLMTQNMASLYRSYKLEPKVRFVSITVNPENDTPERLRSYKAEYEISGGHWVFLTGPREEIKRVAVESFKLGSMEEPVFHSPSFALIDQHGYIRGYYDGTKKDDVQVLFKDIAHLID